MSDEIRTGQFPEDSLPGQWAFVAKGIVAAWPDMSSPEKELSYSWHSAADSLVVRLNLGDREIDISLIQKKVEVSEPGVKGYYRYFTEYDQRGRINFIVDQLIRIAKDGLTPI